jgi:REP element-mobilizing transposase RayT
MPTWLFTNTYYGTWLPGDPRGSITSVRDHRPGDPAQTTRREHDVFGTPHESPNRGLYRSALQRLKAPPIYFDQIKAQVVLSQFQETAAFRSCQMLAIAILDNHLHWIVTADDPVDPQRLLADFKAYGSRALNRQFGKPTSGTWWTSKGSCRWLLDEVALDAARDYVLNKQPNPLVTWSPDFGR